MKSIITVEHLRKIYRVGDEKVVALNDINLEIGRGEICCIVGASGSGKSTLLNQLAGLEKPTKGRVLIGKHIISEMSEEELAVFRQQHLGFIFQSYNLLPSMTAIENVALPLMFKGIPRKQREKMARRELKRMGLLSRSGHKPTEMSGGQQQRVGIARALMQEPKIMLADEPVASLDPQRAHEVVQLLHDICRADGICTVVSLHQVELARHFADRIIALSDGRIVFDGRPEELDEDTEHRLYATEETRQQEFSTPTTDSNGSNAIAA